MGTDKLYECVQDPQIFVLLYKLYLESNLTKEKQSTRHGDVDEEVDDDFELIEDSDEEEDSPPMVIEQLTVQHNTDHVDMTNLSTAEFCKLFENGENGQFFKSHKEKYFVEMIDFVYENILNHPQFIHINSFPISFKVQDLTRITEKTRERIEKLVGFDISFLLRVIEQSLELSIFLDSMKLTCDLKRVSIYSFNSITKMSVFFPTFELSQFSEIITKFPNIEEIDCEYYKIRYGTPKFDYKTKNNTPEYSNQKQVIEVTIIDQVHMSVVENLLFSNPFLVNLNANLKFWLEHPYHKIYLNNVALGVVVPVGQSRLFKALFKNHRIAQLVLYPVEDPLVSMEDFRKTWKTEFQVLDLLYNLQHQALTLKVSPQQKNQLKSVVKKIDKLAERIEEEESADFLTCLEECLVEFEEIKN